MVIRALRGVGGVEMGLLLRVLGDEERRNTEEIALRGVEHIPLAQFTFQGKAHAVPGRGFFAPGGGGSTDAAPAPIHQRGAEDRLFVQSNERLVNVAVDTDIGEAFRRAQVEPQGDAAAPQGAG